MKNLFAQRDNTRPAAKWVASILLFAIVLCSSFFILRSFFSQHPSIAPSTSPSYKAHSSEPEAYSSFFILHSSFPDSVDRLNELSYAYHYRSLDTTAIYARQAITLSQHDDDGRAEALNNLAFVSISKMDYRQAYRQLDSISSITDNQVELLVADIQRMRLCQRESRNKEFYDCHEQASRRMRRIQEEASMLNDHQRRRMVYAQSEFNIVTSTYYYYVGLERQSVDALLNINPDGELRTDTAQLLAYYYNIGAGGIITEGSAADIAQQEFDHLLRCYLLAQQHRYPFWEANSLQALSEHLQQEPQRSQLIQDNLPAMKFLNTDQMPDSLLAGNLAQRSLELFQHFGDVYQIAGSYRTLAQCYWHIADYRSALICLENALEKNKAILQAPDLVASIREQLSLVYSALDDKQSSDLNRNSYLDLQDETRQDRYLEARADQLEKSSQQLNWIITIVVVMIVLLLFLLFLFDWLRRRTERHNNLQSFLAPLQEWQRRNEQHVAALEDRYEEVCENHQFQTALLRQNKERHLEQRAKVSLVNSITPFIDRMLHEIHRLMNGNEPTEVRHERHTYVCELTDQINDYNNLLTEWIQMRQGQLSLRIESFPLQPLFDIVGRGRTSFQMKEVQLRVEPTGEVVKADRILTLFMINTLADNARKFTPAGGEVRIAATAGDDYVEIAVEDTGVGMSAEERDHLFDYKPLHESTNADAPSHGFGLMNCKGIIEKYKKMSQLFAVCSLDVTSEQGRGSRLSFRLPKGVAKAARSLAVLAVMLLSAAVSPYASAAPATPSAHSQSPSVHSLASSALFSEQETWADSVYQCNVDGRYEQALAYADSCLAACNTYYLAHYPQGTLTLSLDGAATEPLAEVKWYQQELQAPYAVLLSIRNEAAVAALALHQWQLYYYNNKVYTHLFNEMSADNTLGDYCREMQRSESNKNIAIAILLLLLLSIFPAYYVMYYRHRLHERFCRRRLQFINDQLLSDTSAEEKLREIRQVNSDRFPEQMQAIVNQIVQALSDSVEVNQQRQTDIELMEDECRRVQLENERYHVVNSVLDNCLSTLKHETMYYPSRIRQLIDSPEADMQSVEELAVYYKDLYSILSQQAMRQVETMKPVCRAVAATEVIGTFATVEGQPDNRSEQLADLKLLGDADMLRYLFTLLQRQNQGERPQVDIRRKDGRYVQLAVHLTVLTLSAEQCRNLFSPSGHSLPFFLCRQIVRDTGESTNLRGCGIVAEPAEQGTDVVVTLGVK